MHTRGDSPLLLNKGYANGEKQTPQQSETPSFTSEGRGGRRVLAPTTARGVHLSLGCATAPGLDSGCRTLLRVSVAGKGERQSLPWRGEADESPASSSSSRDVP